MKTIHLNLHKKWFDMINSNQKKQEYRKISPYYCSKLLKVNDEVKPLKWWKDFFEFYGDASSKVIQVNINEMVFTFRQYETATFSNGYAKKRPLMIVAISAIEISTGFGDWGAMPNEKYFVLNLNEVQSSVNIKKKVVVPFQEKNQCQHCKNELCDAQLFNSQCFKCGKTPF